jgi:hypothetical protein
MLKCRRRVDRQRPRGHLPTRGRAALTIPALAPKDRPGVAVIVRRPQAARARRTVV